jgi:uncharacterized protein YceK
MCELSSIRGARSGQEGAIHKSMVLVRALWKRISFAAAHGVILLGMLLLCVPACSTLATLSTGDSYLYSGTRANIKSIGPWQGDHGFGAIQRCIAIFDFPCSLALDTAFIFFTLPMQLIRGDKPDPPPPSLQE